MIVHITLIPDKNLVDVHIGVLYGRWCESVLWGGGGMLAFAAHACSNAYVTNLLNLPNPVSDRIEGASVGYIVHKEDPLIRSSLFGLKCRGSRGLPLTWAPLK